MPSIYEAIIADHENHRALLDRISATTGASVDRKAAWASFYHDVKSHAAAEEETFYSKLIAKTWGQDAARHSVHEHKKLDDLLEELNEADMSSPGWLTRFKTLRHDYLHHMDEEEGEVFALAREVISTKEIDGFGKRFQARKTEEMGLIEQKKAASLVD
ncbi:hemerythrin domain-containing protein [Oceaniovalibus sp. ACAM 378]|uniref:hemerythrin domain-containing protein n=1 Tax=Oceaniovalibus sp. ACAM 378 TaxID=2599923 RepID=UPI0011DBDB0B|nr:hemerythrin domain-containing protein [Oceaniovalibus sp. ACAM 378]TYB89216.1 hemerythrin domain-containing protein [Oceaniovalibus sp. ACAM 378]